MTKALVVLARFFFILVTMMVGNSFLNLVNLPSDTAFLIGVMGALGCIFLFIYQCSTLALYVINTFETKEKT